MLENNINNVVYYSFESLGDLTHGFSTRIGGVSPKPYDTMNLSFSRGDEIDNVFENFNRLSKAMVFDKNSIVFSHQVHDTNVAIVGQKDVGKGIFRESDIKNTDGLITNEKDVVLTTFYADCVPLFFYDEKNSAIGLSHAGWRGTVNKMAEKTIRTMMTAFGTKAENLKAAIGPSICYDCFMVSSDVYEEFKEKIPGAMGLYSRESHVPGKYHINLQEINKFVMMESGILEENIELPGLCTKCRPDLFFSHRRDGSERGSLAAFMSLKGRKNG